MIPRPNSLQIIAVTTTAVSGKKKQRRIEERLTHHAAPISAQITLCGFAESKATEWAKIDTGRRYLVDGVEHVVWESWPKHWPSTDNRPICAACLAAVELQWRKTTHAPNVRLATAATDLERLAKEATPLVAEAKDVLASLGYPAQGGDGRSTDTSDGTGATATEALTVSLWVERERDLIAEAIAAVKRLDDHHEPMRKQTRKAVPPIKLKDKPTCGAAQAAMSDDDRDGWTLDLLCGSLGTRANGLCHRCGMRYDRRSVEAA